MFIHLIPAIGTKYSLAKGLGTQYRDVSENEVFHFMVLSVRGPALLNRGVAAVVQRIEVTVFLFLKKKDRFFVICLER